MFNPNDPAPANGNIFGFPCTQEESNVIIIPVSSDITCSYGKGTAYAPERILEESTQLDFYSPYLEKAWEQKLFMLPIDKGRRGENTIVGEQASLLIQKQEEGKALTDEDKKTLRIINAYCAEQTGQQKALALKFLAQGKTVVVLGGDHNSPLGLMQALAENYDDYGILQIDAHADLRESYEGFVNSHASIMFNALKTPQISKLVQVGVRDICPDEVNLINNSKGRIKTFFDWDLKEENYQGKTWQQQCNEIVNELPQNVYISFDIDGLDPKLCPNTGTPVAGGLEYNQAVYLIKKVVNSGRQIIGADLCEVGNGVYDANVGARLLFSLVTLITKS